MDLCVPPRLQDQCLRNINVVVQRMSMIGNSRFENAQQPPFGLPICLSSYSGKILTQVHCLPCQSVLPHLDQWYSQTLNNQLHLQLALHALGGC